MEELDFNNAAEEARAHINTWVAEKTEGENTVLLSLTSILLFALNARFFTRHQNVNRNDIFL